MCLKTFRIGGLCLRLVSDTPILDTDFFSLFRAADDAPADLTVRVLRSPLPLLDRCEAASPGHRRSVVADGVRYNYTFFPDAARLVHVPYACAVRQGSETVLYVDHEAPFWDTMIFDAAGLPDVFLERSAALVHAAFIGVGTEGVLFAGPKQTGKTTQARLWRDYAGALPINDDRALVSASPEGFTASGVPFCGSSRVCLNEQRPLKAVVFPERGEENAVTALSPFQSFQRLLGCFSYTETDPASLSRAVSFAQRIAEGCRCLKLCCRPDAGAVQTLKNELGML